MSLVDRHGTPAERRFHGACMLVVLHLRRVAKTGDLDICFEAARALSMIDEDDERFIRSCFVLDERFSAGESVEADLKPDTAARLQGCALKLNSADPA